MNIWVNLCARSAMSMLCLFGALYLLPVRPVAAYILLFFMVVNIGLALVWYCMREDS